MLEEKLITLGDDVFKRYRGDKFTGGTLLSSFEAIVPGVYDYLEYWEENQPLLTDKIKTIYNQPQYDLAMRKGTRAIDRMMQLIKFSREWFKYEN